eukprot:COSAG01_NODE_39881_length_470_cov_703.964960_2_plen_48_part_01
MQGERGAETETETENVPLGVDLCLVSRYKKLHSGDQAHDFLFAHFLRA